MTNFLDKLKKGMDIKEIPDIKEELPAAGELPEAEFATEEKSSAKAEKIAVKLSADLKKNKTEIPSVEDLTKEELSMSGSVSEKIEKKEKKKKPAKKKKLGARPLTNLTKKREDKKIEKKSAPVPLKEGSDKTKIKVIKEKKSASVQKPLGEKFSGPEGQLVIDLYETDEDVVIQSAVGGINAEDLDISIENDMVKIKGHRQKTFEEKKRNYFYSECHWGAFSREIILPLEINAGKAKAIIKNGILTIRMPKIDKIDKKKIEIEEEEE